ncbi:MAG: hypothetical protein PHN42_06140 [Bacilli bacterium]|nr:hypothetical protein [Bacilli bacterium]
MRKKRKLTKGEKLLYTMASLCLIFTMILKIFCKAGVGHLSMSVEQLKYDIANQEKTNESLTMQVNELTSFDKVKDVASDMGLAYNNENIIVVGN